MFSETELTTARSECDTSSKDVETAREITESVRALIDRPSDDVLTACSPGQKSLHEMKTARELAAKSRESVRHFVEAHPDDLVTARSSTSLHSSTCNTAGLHHELETLVAVAQTFLQPTEVLPADVQRSVTEVHAPQQQLVHTPQNFDARASSSAQNLGAAPSKQSLASVEGDVQTAAENSSADIKKVSQTELTTARSECDTSSKDVETAREITESVRALIDRPSDDVLTACSPGQKSLHEINESVGQLNTPISFGVLAADVQRSVTEVHTPQQQLTQTPQSFDARASSSAQNLGAAPNKQSLASVEGDVQTAAENSSAESHSHSNLNNGPSEDVVTARSPGPKTEREFNDFSRQLTPLKPAEAISMSYELTTARSECDTSSKDVETAREITESVRQLLASASSSYGDMSTAQTFAKPTEVLPADVQRSVTEVHAPQQQLTQTPQNFDARASSSAQNLGAAPSKESLASVEGEVKTAAETSTADITSLSRYHSFENIHPEIEQRDEDELPSTPEQLLALDRQKRDPSSYYYEVSLNKGPVDRAPRLRQVSSRYAVNELSNYAMDEPNQAYKLKTRTFLSNPLPSTSSVSNLGLRIVPSEYALENPDHAYKLKTDTLANEPPPTSSVSNLGLRSVPSEYALEKPNHD